MAEGSNKTAPLAGPNDAALPRTIEFRYGVKFLQRGEGLDVTQKAKSVPFDQDEYVEINQVLKKTAELFGLDAVRALDLRFVKVVDPENEATCKEDRLARIPYDHPLKGTGFEPTSTGYNFDGTIELRDTPRQVCNGGVEIGIYPCTIKYDIYDVAEMVGAVLDGHIRGIRSCQPLLSSEETLQDNAAYLGARIAGRRQYTGEGPEAYQDTERGNEVTDMTTLRERLRAKLGLALLFSPLFLLR